MEENFGYTGLNIQNPTVFVYDIDRNSLKELDLGLGDDPKEFPTWPMFDADSQGLILTTVEYPFGKQGPTFILNKQTHLQLISSPQFKEDGPNALGDDCKLVLN
mmetsp:Transcript_37547/g.57519  ORF Transcript_37547/g.57519 Transcript_37547/m.57519 type:complete len:104 (+) Transcript_37547:655-966(+)